MKKIYTLTWLLLALHTAGFCQWNGNPAANKAVCTANGTQNYPLAAPDGDGGAFVCWQDTRDGNYFGNIYAQHINKNGVSLWAANGIAVSSGNHSEHPRIAADGAGGIIVAWIDHRYANTTNTQEGDIFVQRVDATGHALWVDNGVAADSNANVKARIAVISDGGGGAYLAWDEYDNHASLIYGQHVRSDGSLAWGTLPYPHKLCYPGYGFGYEPQLVTDGRNGMIVTWFDDRDGTDNIYAQRFDSSGLRKWDYQDLVICNADYDQQFPAIISDGSKGAIIVWDDNRAGFLGPTYDVYAQLIDSTGNKKWLSPSDPWYNNNGIPVCVAQRRQFLPQLTSDSAGGAYIGWADERGNYDLYAQRVRKDGSTVFETDGRLITTSVVYPGAILFSQDANKLSMMTDNKGNAVMVWSDNRDGYNYNIYGQSIDSLGNKLWAANDVAISTAGDLQQRAQVIPAGDGNGIVFWEDNRNSANTGTDIYTSLLTSSGTLPVTQLSLKGNYAKNEILLQWQTATEFNSRYFVIQRINNSPLFDSIGRVDAAGVSSALLHYSFTDAAPGRGNNYYRLKQVDRDGKFTFSNIVLVKAGNAPAVQVYPNPAARYITISIPGVSSAESVVIYNMQGQAVKQWQRVPVNKPFDVSQLAAGQYTISIRLNNTISTSKIIVQP
ncbi:MAG TPA: T9SS type A sorting domain-containing protein [Chitinophagaceae bacterium]|nr:T9SS type A sorting domain-containing protein [Chitinophagaceae bacterium]